MTGIGKFASEWLRHVSNSNWLKGQLIAECVAAMRASGSPKRNYSDETLAHLVGGITSQHVGRLRQVYERFKPIAEKHPTLYWAHFVAALEWDDAEEWLEEAAKKVWSVQQMRGAKWEDQL